MGKIRLGCSGWDYEEWIGPLYQSSGESKLGTYSSIFDTAEINSTFYRNPTRGMVFGWMRYTPEDFVFTAKVPQTVTHDKLLDVKKDVKADLEEFCNLMRPLLDSGKLGPLLIQLPPRLRFQEERVREFFRVLPKDFEFAIEFRNHSWMCQEAFDLLAEQKVAYTIVDEPFLPPDVKVTSNIAYIRWHGRGKRPWYDYQYTEEELQSWVPKIEEVTNKSEKAYGFFNNHFHGYAPENCLEVLEILGLLTSEQKKAKERIEEYRKGVLSAMGRKVVNTTLEDFSLEAEDRGVEEVLSRFISEARMERAKAIPSKDLRTIRNDKDLVEAEIRGYHIILDLKNKRIEHDCEDWKKQLMQRDFCKHISKLFLSMPRQEAREILEKIRSEPESWEFVIFVEKSSG